MNPTEQYIYYTVLVLVWCQFFWELILLSRQRGVILRNTQVPTELIGILSQKTFEKSRVYALDKNRYSFVHDVYLFLVSMGIMFLNGLPYLWNLGGDILKHFGFEPGDFSQGAVFLVLMNSFNTFSLLPFSVYYHFVLEQKHGFNKQTLGFFFRDKIKHFILQVALLIPILCGVAHIVKIGGDYFFLYAWVFVVCATLFLYTIYPEYLAPLLDKYTPLPDGLLKSEIEKVARGVGFPLYQISILENSKKSAHSNAFIFGVFNHKKIVVFDTLVKQLLREDEIGRDEDRLDTMEIRQKELEKMKAEKNKGCDLMEVLAIVGHELGHWHHNHIAKKMTAMQLNMLLAFVLFAFFTKYQGIYEPFGFNNGAPILMSLIIVLHFILLPFFGIYSYGMAIMSRHCEFEADRFAKSLGRGQYLKCALIKLNHDNLGFPVFDPLYSSWHNSHPPLLERLQHLDKDD